MKAYKIEILVIDDEEVGPEQIKEYIEDANFPNYCLALKVKNMIEKEIGEFNDDHPLNKKVTCEAEYKKLFGEKVDEKTIDNLLAIIKLIRYSDSKSWKVGQSGGQDSYVGLPDIMRTIDAELKKIGINLMENGK